MKYERAKLDTTYFFWGPLSDGQAAYLLQDSPEGTYLARETVKNASEREFNIIVKIRGGITSLPVLRRQSLLSLDFLDFRQPRAVTLYGLIQKLVQKTRVDSAVCTLDVNSAEPIPLRMIEPYKRISSLKAHCRRALRMKYDVQEIEGLPLPNQMKKYLTAIY